VWRECSQSHGQFSRHQTENPCSQQRLQKGRLECLGPCAPQMRMQEAVVAVVARPIAAGLFWQRVLVLCAAISSSVIC
jgi:hypothetical protein